jgi:hypothetical protein
MQEVQFPALAGMTAGLDSNDRSMLRIVPFGFSLETEVETISE